MCPEQINPEGISQPCLCLSLEVCFPVRINVLQPSGLCKYGLRSTTVQQQQHLAQTRSSATELCHGTQCH